jgi:regulator of nucleoside diphosphate kinase
MQMASFRDVLLSARDAEALGLMLGNAPRGRRLEDEAAAALAEKLSAASIVPPGKLPADVVTMESTVTYVEQPEGGERTVSVVFPAQADAGAGRVSVLSPIGHALLGRAVGSVIDVALLTGRRFAIRIVDVARGRIKDEQALALV